MVTTHRYQRSALIGGYLRAGLGGAVALGLGALGRESAIMSVICVTFFAICLAYGARTAIRGASVVILNDSGLSQSGPLRRRVPWHELTDLRLAYYTTRRDGENGWMELTLAGRGGRMTIDSDIDGFSGIAARSLREAEGRGLQLSGTTLQNFNALLKGRILAEERPHRA